MRKSGKNKLERSDSESTSTNENDGQANNHNIYLQVISDNINKIQKYFNNHIFTKDKIAKEKLNLFFSKIESSIKFLAKEKDSAISQYESILRFNEHKLRLLYSDIYNLKIKNAFLENNIDILLKKEKELKLVKEKTGVIVENGIIVYNDRKDNEIFILRTENSTLKNIINNNEKELNEVKEKYKNIKEVYDKQISSLNNKINQLKYKLRQSNPKTKGKSCSNITVNNNDGGNHNIKLNFTINNSLNKVKNNRNALTNRVTNSNTNINDINNNTNININSNGYKKKYDCILLKNEKNVEKNKNNSEGKGISSLAHCQSTGQLNLKNKIINQLKKINKEQTSNTFHQELNLSNISPIHSKKISCLTPRGKDDCGINFQTFQKISDVKKNKNIKIVNKNCNIIKNCFSNQNINKTNNLNGVKIIYKKNSKNKSTKANNNVANKKQKIKKELTWSQNILMNNSVMPNIYLKINKITVKSKKCNDLNKTNVLKSPKYNGENHKRKRNLITKIVGKEHSIINKTSLTSIKRKNTINSSNNSSCNKNILNSPSSNKI
jgi:hypothetical protein